MPASEAVLFEHDGPIARITLNRPDKHNALSPDALTLLGSLLDRVEADPDIRVLVFTGAGEKTFCAGADLSRMSEGGHQPDLYVNTLEKLAHLTKPSVGALNGNVFGGGVDLALCCDFRIGVEGMKIRIPAIDIGVCYPHTGIERVTWQLGPQIAKRLLVLGEMLNGQILEDCHFVMKLVAREDLMKSANDLAETLSTNAPLSMKSMKLMIHAAADQAIDPEFAKEHHDACWKSADHAEGMKALSEKRKPIFTGR